MNGKYVACLYDNEVWLGSVDDVSTENDDVKINFLHRKDAYTYFFPEKVDTCWVQYDKIINIMSQPDIKPKRKIEYRFQEKELLKANEISKMLPI